MGVILVPIQTIGLQFLILILTMQKFWESKQNQREFMDNFAKKHNIKTQSDWANVNIRFVAMNGGASIIARYGRSLFEGSIKVCTCCDSTKL